MMLTFTSPASCAVPMQVGARLDRNGLRPARYWRTNDDMVYVASEVGVLGDVFDNAANVVAKGRLGPGQVSPSAACPHLLECFAQASTDECVPFFCMYGAYAWPWRHADWVRTRVWMTTAILLCYSWKSVAQLAFA